MLVDDTCLRGTQLPRWTGNDNLFIKICEGIWTKNSPQENWGYVPALSKILWYWSRNTDRGQGTKPSKQIQVSRLNSREQLRTMQN